MNTNFLNANSVAAYANYQQAFGQQLMPRGVFGMPNSSTQYDINLGSHLNDPKYPNPAVLVVDSRHRNHYKYPNPAKYTIKLTGVYKEVVSVELVSADIPNSGYTVENSHNKFYFQDTAQQVDNETYYTITHPTGNYTISEIVANLESLMNSASTGSTYSVTLDSHTMKITIAQTAGSGVFNMLFLGSTEVNKYQTVTQLYYRKQSMGPILGFARADYAGGTSYTAPYTYNLKVDRYVIMNLRSTTDAGRIDSIDGAIQDSFAVVPLDTSINNFLYQKNNDNIANDRYIKFFSEPIPEVNEFDIEFLNPDGDEFNFNGHDHVLMFEIVSLTRLGRYNPSARN